MTAIASYNEKGFQVHITKADFLELMQFTRLVVPFRLVTGEVLPRGVIVMVDAETLGALTMQYSAETQALQEAREVYGVSPKHKLGRRRKGADGQGNS